MSGVHLLSLCCLLAAQSACGEEYHHYEWPPYDGWYNNLAHPDWGAAETQMFRRVPPAYSDGSYEPSGMSRPNPITISQNVFNGSTGTPSPEGRTALLVFFGQQVVEEVLDAQRPGCPPEYFNIDIPQGHPQYDNSSEGGKVIPLLRSRYDMRTGLSPNVPRQQLNEISAWIDGTLMYGPNKAWADALRSYENGELASVNTSDGYFPAVNTIRLPFANPPPPRDHYLKPINRFYKIGNPRGNENPFLLTFGILWFRYHNYRAKQLQANHPDWNDERLFNEARKWVIAVHQKIVMYDWLPSWLGDSMDPYQEYDPTINPGIAHAFQSAAMRFGHTLVPPGVFRRTKDCVYLNSTMATGPQSVGKRALRTCNTYWNPQEGINEHDIDALLLGMASQITEAEDMIITPDLRGDVFGPLEFSRRDLMAVNIQRGRDHGLPDYNTVRESYGLTRHTEWRDINPELYDRDQAIFDRLREVYDDDINNLDLWPAGMLETSQSGPGETFRTIIKDQFRRIRDGDRFWFENYEFNGLYTEEEVAEINSTTLRDVIIATTGIPDEIDVLQENIFRANLSIGCPQPFQLTNENMDHLEACTPVKYYDYFDGNEFWFIFAFVLLGLVLPACILALWLGAKCRRNQVDKHMTEARERNRRQSADGTFTAVEWVGYKEGSREVKVDLKEDRKQIIIKSARNKLLRTIDLKLLQGTEQSSKSVNIIMSADRQMRMLLLRIPREYDLVLTFDNTKEKDNFYNQLRDFIKNNGMGVNSPKPMTERTMKKECFTKDKRDQILASFFRAVFAHSFSDEATDFPERELSKNVISCELTRYEFAYVLAMKSDSLFVENMFNLVDKDGNGFISFREFLDVIVIFSKGSGKDKAKLMFDMYDLDGSGTLDRDEFKMMIRSMMELANDKLEDSQMEDLIKKMFRSVGISDKSEIKFSDFNRMLQDYEDELNFASLGTLNVDAPGFDSKQLAGRRENGISRARRTVIAAYRTEADDRISKNARRYSKVDEVRTVEKKLSPSPLGQKYSEILSFFEKYKLHLFWIVLYTLVCCGIFIERAYYYSIEREHGGLRGIAGYGVSITRGAASAMMFTYSCLLVTMCRNLITKLRETFLHVYIPFDAAIWFHKYVAYLALLFTIAHCIGHGFNFYHISTQTADDTICLFRDYFHPTDYIPTFNYWLWGTLTGFTGVLATVVVFIMYVFAQPHSRRNLYKVFWFTHHLYIVLYILMFLHGAGRLVQPPFFHYFFLGPVILFLLDKTVSISRRKVEIQVLKADLLPSDVLHLRFHKPLNFEYKSGQWVRIASVVHGENEYHPFTLTSAPHEDWLSLHIRAVGPWTMNVRNLYDPNNLKDHALPKIFLDGPYGEGHQDWYKYEVAILVGGGIGVTPFASILKDIAHRTKGRDKIQCKKVYFIWVTKTQKHYEWLTDIIREVEERDKDNKVSVHIFITQFKQKFDVRTTMLYICERYFQKISHRSLFTGLRSVTHFGRPDFNDFLKILRMEHTDTDLFGVFSCGPPQMTSNVEKACNHVNMEAAGSQGRFIHHFENF